MKSLFFISKPLELLGAIEAKKQFEITDAVLIIKCDKSDDKTIDFLIKKSGNWNTIIRTKRKSSYGLSWLKLVKKLQKEPYEYLFTRAFPIASYFVHNLKYNELYLLDDGTMTIVIANEFRENNNLTKRFSLFRGKNKKGLKYNLIRKIYSFSAIKTEKPINEICFFTYYDLSNTRGLKTVKNNFDWLHSLKKELKSQDKNVVYLLGTNVVKGNFLNFEDYFTTLKKIKEHYLEKEIIYIPHPKEDNLHLQKIKEQLYFKIKKNEFNVELDFMLHNKQPKHIVGTITTALITLKLIYKDKISVDFFNFDTKKVFFEKIEIVNSLYEYQKKYLNFNELKY